MTAPNVVYIVPDKMGGMLNIVAGLLEHRDDGAMAHHAVLTHNTLSTDTRFAGRLHADTQRTLEYTLPVENLHSVLKRLRDALPSGEGVLVANDLLELALLHVYDPRRMVMQITHGDWDYYYDLAARHEAVIDVFATYSRRMYDTLRARLPHREADVRYLPYGVVVAPDRRQPADGPLRIVFAGRLAEVKGVHDLPAIDRQLRDRGVECRWTMIGDGPAAAEIRAAWSEPHVEWRGMMRQSELLAWLPRFDVFILPTRAEGFPVALVEAMAAGLVPVVSDIPSGVPEIVDQGISGFRCPVGDNTAFADAIGTMALDRPRLEVMSRAARAKIERDFDVRARTRAYQDVYATWRELRRPRPATLPLPYGSRLDQAWAPNAVVRSVRTAVRRLKGKPV